MVLTVPRLPRGTFYFLIFRVRWGLMPHGDVILRFEEVSYGHGHNKPILDAVSFSLRQGMKFTLMGQNGAGKSTLFKLIMGELKPDTGDIHLGNGIRIATARQTIPRDELDLTVREFFSKCFPKKVYDIDPKIDAVLEIVNLLATAKGKDIHERHIKSFSGGQQARLLLASALIQDHDLLLLDEPTNNLDKAGIAHLTDFLIRYEKTCIVISHDAEFLNAFSDGVFYLDVHTQKLEQYAGNYVDVLKEITARVERENRKNALLAKEIQENKEKANFFANKGGNMRALAKKMREKAADMEEEKVVVRKEDRTIRPFTIPAQPEIIGEVLSLTALSLLKNHKVVERKVSIGLRKKYHLLLAGPNGIGKSTLLESIAQGTARGMTLGKGVRVGYYRQDFSNLDLDQSVYQCLVAAMDFAGVRLDEERLRSVAAGFLINSEVIRTKIGALSEGQKGLVAFARLVLEQPGLLILDEPTNHMNFRHLPVIAAALDKYEGAMILVSHVPAFVKQIRIDETLDLEK